MVLNSVRILLRNFKGIYAAMPYEDSPTDGSCSYTKTDREAPARLPTVSVSSQVSAGYNLEQT